MDEVVTLVKSETTTDSMGMETVEPSKSERRTVFAAIKSIGMSEHYQALALNQVPEIKAEIHADEYQKEPFLVYDGETYKISRTYKKGERLELVCERVKPWA